jgi:hypothetical protein
MLEVLLAAVVTAVVAVLLTRWTTRLAGRLGGERLHSILADAEYIVDHHAVPPAWQAELAEASGGPTADGARTGRQERRRARARRACLRRLRRLIAFSRRTSIVADEEAREVLLSELTQVSAQWQSASWAEMCSGGAQDAPAPAETSSGKSRLRSTK